MRIVRVLDGGSPTWGILEADGRVRALEGAPWAGGAATERVLRADALLAPAAPSKIVCVGRNYAAHAKELGNEVPKEPLLFFKPPSALVGPGGAIELPPDSARVEHEGELVLVIGKRVRHAKESEALDAVFGITAGNDVTARDLQKKDVQFTRGKGFDTFCAIGPWIETELGDLSSITVQTRVDGAVRQHGSTKDLIFPVPTLLAYISRIMTLEPGDLVMTGTPEGVGPLVAGDVVEVEVSGVGTLSNPVRRASES